ncbi:MULTISPECIES: membrane protein insertase YidC [unclassified Roseateles]|uniref:membrane protein insertase YidC n=1 Tax=unclassified Roseateles TaxID=2626991 RepID=UPI0006F8293A|nr:MULTISPECIES: membrane protein insertase YidC [unclassified Roseateles]KQW46700.1 insertase [Pelomonas sp. Root405]KRA73752.1 insertase [Pelomonas sp. Root662]
MTDIRRTVLWVVFTMSLVLLWDGWQKHNGQPSMFSPAPRAASTAPASPASGGVPSAIAGAAQATGAVPAPAAAAPSEKITVRTDVLTVTVDTLGGDIVRAELPKYLTSYDPDVTDQLLQMVGLQKKPEFKPQPVVLFNAGQQYRAQTGLVGGPAPLPTHNTPMTAVEGPRELEAGSDEVKLRLESPEVGGVKLVKTYTFKRGAYTIGVTHEIINAGAAAVTPQVYLQLVRDGSTVTGGAAFTPSFTGPAVYSDKAKFQTVTFEDIDKNKVDIEKQATDGWVSMIQHYFASAWLVNEQVSREFFVRKLPGQAGVRGDTYATGMVFTLPTLAPGASTTQQATLFAGPQEENNLAKLAPGLERVKDYGVLTILAEPLFWLLDKLHGFIGNWGWTIVALVVLLKIALYWLNASAYKSMAKMKAVAPRVAELKERYKDKPQEMQQEMMKIYREEKVNPIGGCLPIFAQMPIFMALYWVLLSTVEMRQAPWILWITDLSVRDPYFILPLLMMATSLFQVWLNPPAADPMQQKMMWIMPVAFGVMFFVFPAGLVLYWLTNNILSIAQQWMINKQMGVN